MDIRIPEHAGNVTIISYPAPDGDARGYVVKDRGRWEALATDTRHTRAEVFAMGLVVYTLGLSPVAELATDVRNTVASASLFF